MRVSIGIQGKALVWLASGVLFVCIGQAGATDLFGTYTTPQVITEDSRLTGDVECAATLIKSPCIVFGTSHIKLSLNGFTITGPVDPLNPEDFPLCSQPGPPIDVGIGIEADGQNHIKIEGPGIVQHFQRWGIFLRSSTGDTVRNVTATRNCWSGLQATNVYGSIFEHNVWANNAAGSNGAGCGGLCFTSSNNNRLRKSTFYGNGTVVSPSTTANGNVDFGVGLEGTSSGNLIEENQMGGNANGILDFDTSHGNVIRRNVLVGNPAAEVRVEHPERDGADIHDLHATAGANTYEDNLCLTYSGPGTAPCPNIGTHREEGDARDNDQEETTNRLTGPGKNQIGASHNGEPADGSGIFSVAVLLLATVFRKVIVG